MQRCDPKPLGRIAFLALDRDFAELEREYLDAYREVVASGNVVGGKTVERLEATIAPLIGRRHIIATSSGTDALRIMLASVGVGPGWNVIIPAVSFIATGDCVLTVGARPVIVDVDAHCHLDLNAVEAALKSPAVRECPTAVVAVGLFGDGLRDDDLIELCARYGVTLVEDAAQSFGSRHGKLRGGQLGLASSLSFAPTKNVPCFGNAGAIATDDDAVAQRARLCRTHGKSSNRAPACLLGINGALAASHAAQLTVSLSHLTERAARRRASAQRYLDGLSGLDGIQVPLQRAGTVHGWHKFVLTLDGRDDLAAHLQSKGIESQCHYPIALCDEPILAPFVSSPCPVARAYARRCLTLPMHPFHTTEELDFIIDAIRQHHALSVRRVQCA